MKRDVLAEKHAVVHALVDSILNLIDPNSEEELKAFTRMLFDIKRWKRAARHNARHVQREHAWTKRTPKFRVDTPEGEMLTYAGIAAWLKERELEQRLRWDPLESTCRHASLSIL